VASRGGRGRARRRAGHHARAPRRRGRRAVQDQRPGPEVPEVAADLGGI